MGVQVPIFTIYGKDTQEFVQLERLGGADVRLTISDRFAGRNVEEDLRLSELTGLLADPSTPVRDLLGLQLETDGGDIQGVVSVGSGNERFVLPREAFVLAVQALASAE